MQVAGTWLQPNVRAVASLDPYLTPPGALSQVSACAPRGDGLPSIL